jgi:hypothetical protein
LLIHHLFIGQGVWFFYGHRYFIINFNRGCFMGSFFLALIAGFFIGRAYYLHNKEAYISKLMTDLFIALICLVVGLWKSLANL